MTDIKRCPACGLPIALSALGDVLAATSDDGHRHAVVGICRRCTGTAARLPRAIYRKTLNRAAERALADPGRYLCAPSATAGAARLAIGMRGHPAHVLEALNALGWMDGIDPRK